MKEKRGKDKSIGQRVANRAKERGLARTDAVTAYAMDRLLHRLGRSSQAAQFYLKGGVLVANLISAPHRFTRDIDLLRRKGPPDPEDIRGRFRKVVATPVDDGVHFDPKDVRAVPADHDDDGYDGVKVLIKARVLETVVDLRLDIGFGDAVLPAPERIDLDPFLPGDEPARVMAYRPEAVLAEKIETLLSKFPLIEHRLKDLLDVVALAGNLAFDGPVLTDSLRATLAQRKTKPDVAILDEMRAGLAGKKWLTAWSVMQKEKAVASAPSLEEAVRKFGEFVRPPLSAVGGAPTPGAWGPGGPWS